MHTDQFRSAISANASETCGLFWVESKEYNRGRYDRDWYLEIQAKKGQIVKLK